MARLGLWGALARAAAAAAAAGARRQQQPQQRRGLAAGAALHHQLHHHPPRRAMLYVPGSDERKLRKARARPRRRAAGARVVGAGCAAHGRRRGGANGRTARARRAQALAGVAADCVVMDCEDGVAPAAKADAREAIARALDGAPPALGGEAAVRINPPSSGALAEDDLAAVLGARALPDALVVPKVEGPDDVAWIFDRVARELSRRGAPPRRVGGGPGPLALVTMCESAVALLDLRRTFEAALARGGAGGAALQLQAAILGGDDLAASLGATRSADNGELAHARGQFLLTCRAMQLQAIDIVNIDLSEAGLRALAAEARQAALQGWSGKQVIHPKQVSIVADAFSPTDAQVAAAVKLVAAAREQSAAGRGAFLFEGRMIDAPTVLQARNVLALAERLDQQAANE
ncbi:Clybl [Scenedesmus sp. PABB004]|nr:Clybl [Scenedesmus sp. PABB004]